MHRTFSVPRLLRWWSLVIAAAFLIWASPEPAHTQGPPNNKDLPVIVMGVGTAQTYQMYTKDNLKKVENDNAKVLNVSQVKLQPNTVLFEAISPGRSRVRLEDQAGRFEHVEVVVVSDRVKELSDMIRRAVPTASVSVTSSDSGNTVLLTGTVLTTDDARAIQQIAAGVGGNVVNNIRIGGVQQVQLEVLIAVVNRSEARNMTFSWAHNSSNFFISSIFGGPFAFTNAIATATAGAASDLSTTGGANLPFGIVNSRSSFQGFLQALRTENLAKIIAEPRLMTLSGRPAFLVSGGETPLLTSSGQGAPSISYKQFGTVVNFLPIVLGNGKIHLEVRPELSDIDNTLGISIPGLTPTIVPGFRTRSAQVAVQMEDGQTLAIGGLIQNNVNATISRVPVLGDLPVLGMAFTSKSYVETEQELIILVTPRLVDPVDCCKIPKYLPGRETRVPDDFELFVEGIIEAPRGPRNVSLHPRAYQAAFQGAANIGQIPCGDGAYGRHGGNCANGHCDVSGGHRTHVGGMPIPTSGGTQFAKPAPTPSFPAQRFTTDSVPMPTMTTVPGSTMSRPMEVELLPAQQPLRESVPALPPTQYEARPALPPGPYTPR
jgi:pilus assembly protein CpaC